VERRGRVREGGGLGNMKRHKEKKNGRSPEFS